ncbi:hypothetical protein [Armatimonas sp.]|uniref:hypothetical protein n=1 Tax=Armatimonas sp. TaxID=1872638 RepID=UPI00374CE59A
MKDTDDETREQLRKTSERQASYALEGLMATGPGAMTLPERVNVLMIIAELRRYAGTEVPREFPANGSALCEGCHKEPADL